MHWKIMGILNYAMSTMYAANHINAKVISAARAT